MDSSSSSSSGYLNEMIKVVMNNNLRMTELLAQLASEEAETSNAESIPRAPRRYYEREHAAAHDQFVQDYFADDCTYPPEMFRRRFRMSKQLFLRIVADMEREYTYFQQRPDARGKMGLSGLQKCTATLRQMAYGASVDTFDEYLRIAESTGRLCIKYFTKGIIALYGDRYLRKPTFADIQHLYAAHESRHGFPGMLGSIDCMHWDCSYCLTAWRGQFMRGDHNRPVVMLEVVASQDLWIWHAFFECSGSSNDINVLQQSLLLHDVYHEKAPECPFEVNGVQYKHDYYLADEIYPNWETFVKSFTGPTDQRRLRFKNRVRSRKKRHRMVFWCAKETLTYNTIPGKTMEAE